MVSGAIRATREPSRAARLGPSGECHGYAAQVANVLEWIAEQARNGMAIACGCATTHGDDGGGLEMLNSILSDIEINAAMVLDGLVATQSKGETE
jgi:succinylglutamate desuccinylase